MAELRLGALEAGGTKMVCAIGDENGEIYEQISIPTTMPKETIPKMIAYFRDKGIDALGIACFGPIELDRDSEKYGYITTTPKLAWRDCDIVGQMQEALHCPVGFDTDVNGSVLGEVTFGQAQGKKCVMYLTIGTGVGGGIYSNGKLHHGMLHPETGHVLITKRTADTYAGRCPYHKNCLEGLAALGQESSGSGRLPGSMGVGGRLHCAGPDLLCHDGISGNDHFRRRCHAPGAVVPADPQEA
jgi:fructokinase